MTWESGQGQIDKGTEQESISHTDVTRPIHFVRHFVYEIVSEKLSLQFQIV